jgi:AcrR family transcriptional regulator
MTTTPDQPSDLPEPASPLRRDAQRNLDAIVAAARQVFCDHGLEAPLEEIARQAGVGIATLYRRFPSRVELLDAVLADTVQAHVEVAEQALAMNDPWDGFTYYLEATSRLQATDRGLNDAMGMRFPRAATVEAAKTRLFDLVAQVIDRAHPLPQPPLAPRQVHRAMLTLGRRSAATPTSNRHRQRLSTHCRHSEVLTSGIPAGS